MKRSLIIFVLALVAGCAQPGVTPTGAQAQIAKACAVVQPTLVTMQAMSAADPAQADALAEVVAVNGKVCAVSTTVDVATVRDAVQNAIPAAVRKLALMPGVDPVVKMDMQIGLAAFQVALSAAIVQFGPAP